MRIFMVSSEWVHKSEEKKMNLLIDTTTIRLGERIVNELQEKGKTENDYELIETANMHISHCLGCNYCWLKTPGVCVIKDDYEPILKKINKADQVWLISDTCFGFVTYQTKNIVDRVMPIATMYLKFKDGQMRHVMRYDHQPNIGIVYAGDGDQAYLDRWCQRTALNFGTRSLGAYDTEHIKEAVSCML